MEEKIEITKKEYEKLLDSEFFLNCLKGAGVDNWQGYGDACEYYEDNK